MQNFLKLVLLSSFSLVAGPVLATTVSSSYPQNFDSAYWEKILHFDGKESRADGKDFFLAPNGKTNPVQELEKTIAAFKDPETQIGWFKYSAQCVFRERYHFLKSQGLLTDIPEEKCQAFDEWKSGINAESVTLIYSSSYPNNPSSLFGHTLLRLNQKNKTNDLLDYAIAFSAIPEKDDPGILFAYKGIAGGYKGLFEITKYYTKVNEYNNGESRDLIEYNLVMTPEELARLERHLWEMYQTTYFDYYFHDENCSAVLADLLSVAYKDHKKVNEHKKWFYLPGEMIKHFDHDLKVVGSVKYRPSLKKQMIAQWSEYDTNETREIQKIINDQEIPEGFSNPKVLDGVLSYLDFTQNRKKEKLEGKDLELQRQALIKRAKLGKKESKTYIFDESN